MTRHTSPISLGILCASITVSILGGCSNDSSSPNQDDPVLECNCETGENCTDAEIEACQKPACPTECPNDCTDGVCNTHAECPAECPNDCTDGVCNTHEECPAECPNDCTDGVCNTHEECPAECPNDCTDGVCNKHTECPAECPNDCTDGVCNKHTECPAECPNDCTDGVCNKHTECPAECPNDCTDGVCNKHTECPAECPNDCTDGVCNTHTECPAECPNDCTDGVCNKHEECPAECPNDCTNGVCNTHAECPTECKNGCDDKGACKCPTECKNGCDDKGACKCPAECPNNCTSTGVCNKTCKYTSIEAPDIRPMEGEGKTNKTETVPKDGFTDVFLYNKDNDIKVGVRKEWGGSIVFFGTFDKPGENHNTIDDRDTGREVQVALYDWSRLRQGCAYNASCQSYKPCEIDTISRLGWNPVQGGNRCNIGSGFKSFNDKNGQIEVSTNPLHWNPAWERTTCDFDPYLDGKDCTDPSINQKRTNVIIDQTIRFIEKHVVELQYTIHNNDNISYNYPIQEIPTVYASFGKDGSPDLSVLMTYPNRVISITQSANDGFSNIDFTSEVPWATLQNESHTYGVGILYENGVKDFQGWQAWVPDHFNNVRARLNYTLPANGVISSRAYLILGSYESIAEIANRLIRTIPPFGVMDYPDGKSAVSGNVDVSGWALDNKGVAKIEARIDEGTRVALSYGSSRPDVCSAWPGYPKCNHVGYSGKISVTGLDKECAHLLEIIATDTDNNERVIDRRLLNVQ